MTTARGGETTVENLLRLDGKTVLVTGAGQGVGRQVALHCAGHGARVVVNDFHLDRAGTVVAEIRAAGGQPVRRHRLRRRHGHDLRRRAADRRNRHPDQ
jgi:NAD(P)-dependent dehydrogenase (short-subunit alcohol dehydrogenase family)